MLKAVNMHHVEGYCKCHPKPMTDKFQKMAEEIVDRVFPNLGEEDPLIKVLGVSQWEVARMKWVGPISDALQSLSSSLAKKFLDAVEEKKYGDEHWEQQQEKRGWNFAREKILEVIKSEGIELNP